MGRSTVSEMGEKPIKEARVVDTVGQSELNH